jgi:ketosteroid isomerase-like protein
MSAEGNKALIRRYFEVIDAECKSGNANADVLDEFLAADMVTHSPNPEWERRRLPPNREAGKMLFKMFATAAPGYHVIEDLIAEGDKVVARLKAYGTHEGELMGIPRTGKQIEMSGIVIWRIADGKIVEHWAQIDVAGLMQQLRPMPV